MIPERQIRANQTEKTVRVYQAFRRDIAGAALAAGTFVSPFRMGRMTWIKPSFLWMMYRSGWGTKPDQEAVLAIDLKKTGFEWALANACLSSFHPDVEASNAAWKARLDATPVRVQWDPEKTIHLTPLPYRSIQIGLTGIAVEHYVQDWIVGISSCDALIAAITSELKAGREAAAKALLPDEQPYLLPQAIARGIGIGITG